MNKFVLLADTHLGYKNGNKWWLELTEKLFDEIIDLCVREDIKTIVHLGDWFHDRKSLPVPVIDKSYKICQKINKNNINLYIIKGNHDQYYNDLPEPHSLSHLKNLPNIHIVDSIQKIHDDIYLVPWGSNLSEIPDNSNVFGHFEINGFVSDYIQPKWMNLSDFKRFGSIYSGHFHTPSKNKNIQYIGSAFPMDFNDIGSSRGYYIYDNGNLKFFEFTSAPKFVRVENVEGITEKNINGNNVEFVFTEDLGSVKNEKIIQDIWLLNPHKLHVDYKIENLEVEDDLETTEDFQSIENTNIFRDYINKKKLPESIDKNMLIKFLEKMEV